MGIEFKLLKAECGDSILVSTYEKIKNKKKYQKHILIDGGKGLGNYILNIKPDLEHFKVLDLVILTHIDNDHICGLIDLIQDKDKKIKEIWFNSHEKMKVHLKSNEKGYSEGVFFEKLLKKYKLSKKHKSDIFLKNYKERKEFNIGDIKLKLLSPLKSDLIKLQEEWKKHKEKPCYKSQEEISDSYSIDDEKTLAELKGVKFGRDGSLKNKSSIAFILEYKTKKYLFLGDARIQVINKSLKGLNYADKENPLDIEFVKLSHHGSKGNINKKFLDLIKTDTFVTLTNGNCHELPNKATYSLIATHKKRAKKIKFIFNYPQYYKEKFSNDDEGNYTFNTTYKETL